MLMLIWSFLSLTAQIAHSVSAPSNRSALSEALSLKCEAVYQGWDTSPIGLFLRTGAQQATSEHLHPSVFCK